MYNRSAWTNRQKILIILTILTFGILVWQIYSLVRSDLSSSEPLNNPTKTSSPANMSIPTPGSATNPNLVSSDATTPASKVANEGNNTPQETNQLPAEVYQNRADLSPNQQEYMRYSREFELAKMQRRLLEEQVAIANARKTIADTEQQTNKLDGNSNFIDPGKNDWRLTFLILRNNIWHATLVHNGDYHNVTTGSKLLDGTKILDINKTGVRFEYHGLIKHLSFVGVKTLSKPHPSTANSPSAIPSSTSTQSIAPPLMSPNKEATPPQPVPLSTKTKAPAVPIDALPNFHQS
jgi:hypothetical protein